MGSVGHDWVLWQDRMINISSALGCERTYWVRFNPDAHVPSTGGRQLAVTERQILLKRVITWLLSKPPSVDDPVIGVIHLCFDGFHPSDATDIEAIAIDVTFHAKTRRGHKTPRLM